MRCLKFARHKDQAAHIAANFVHVAARLRLPQWRIHYPSRIDIGVRNFSY